MLHTAVLRTVLILTVLGGVVGWLSFDSATAREDLASPPTGFSSPPMALDKIPTPEMDELEAAVREQLQQQQAEVDSALGMLTLFRTQTADLLARLGEMYQAYEFNEAAEAVYRNALRLNPQREEWYYNLGYLFQFMGRFEEAIEAYERARAGSVDAYLLWVRIGECHRSLNHLPEAIQAFEAAHHLNPKDPAALARLGETILEQKQYDRAISYLKAALAIQPEANKLHYPLAMAYRGLRDRRKAREHLALRGKVGLQPPDPLKFRLDRLVAGWRLHSIAGKRAYDFGRYEDAVAAFQKAVTEAPDNVSPLINLGTALVRLKRNREALEQFKAALVLEPDNRVAHFNIGTLSLHMGDAESAIQHLRILVDQDSGDAQVHLELGKALLQNHSYTEARMHYEKTLALDPALAEAWIGLSTALVFSSEHGLALEAMEEAHRQLPNNVTLSHALARHLAASSEFGLRDGQRALTLAESIWTAYPSFPHAETLAMAYAETGNCPKAVQFQQTAFMQARSAGEPSERLRRMENRVLHYQTQRPCRVMLME